MGANSIHNTAMESSIRSRKSSVFNVVFLDTHLFVRILEIDFRHKFRLCKVIFYRILVWEGRDVLYGIIVSCTAVNDSVDRHHRFWRYTS